ncbi:hypothetical protein [Priestia abyssalis]|uniref:hypothetical protein n=1 Tax=Priestia abyssalis TaxID=1221450 RepID=UPI000994C564|nr:hypothetical protein [Priestia abyssalis]
MKNEKGYTLLTVLLMIVLITTFGLVLANAAFNTAKQNNITEEDVQVTDLAEMGITYFETEFRTKLKVHLEDLEEERQRLREEARELGTEMNLPPINLVKESKDVISTIIESHLVDKRDDLSFHFKIGIDSVNQQGENQAIIAYTSTGCIKECNSPKKKYSITGKIVISKNPETNPVFPDEISSDMLPPHVTSCTFKKNGQLITSTDCYINPGNSDWTDDIHMNNNQTIHILGNADVNTIKFSSGAIVCVYGSLFVDSIHGNPHNRFLYALSVNPASRVNIETDPEKVYKACLPHLDFSDDNLEDNWDISLDDPIYQ